MDYQRNLEELKEYVDAYDAYTIKRQRVGEFGGQMIRMYRNILKVGIRSLAKSLEVSPSYLSKVERGLEPISPELAHKILELSRPIRF